MTGPRADATAMEPFAADQSMHPLEYWISPELARISPPAAPSRLRELADTQGAHAAAWSSAIGAGPVILAAGALATAMTGNPAAVILLGSLGAALTALGVISLKRVRAALPNTRGALITRGPGSARGGILTLAVLALILGGILAVALPGISARGGAALTAVIGAYALLVAFLAACIAVPAAVTGRARESFRRRVQADPNLRAAVEDDLATWQDPRGNGSYGPL